MFWMDSVSVRQVVIIEYGTKSMMFDLGLQVFSEVP